MRIRRPLVLIFIALIFLGIFSWFSRPVLAEGEFSSSYSIKYEVEPSGLTNVTYRVNVTNLTTQYYVSEYDLTIPSLKIEDIVAADTKGAIIPQITKEEAATKIHLIFNERAVGKENVLSFGLSYKTGEIAQKIGRIWEIRLPPRPANPEITEYTVSLKVPQSFGRAAYFSPSPTAGLTWTKDQLISGVMAAFGDYQLFKFHLRYSLANPKLFPIYTEIALPFDNAYQRVKFSEITPRPMSVRKDEDGNWLARYDLSPGEKTEIKVSGLAKISFFPDSKFSQEKEKLSLYLQEQKYWEVTDAEIKKLAEELKTPKAIYDFVVSTLKYNYQIAQEGGERQGAKEALGNPQKAICMEFTDLFIALARAAGIPAREIDGFAYTTNSKLRPLSLEKDILHAWAEFWDAERQVWVMVDPTWGSTTGGVDYFSKLDFNHLALVVKGASSELPVPAGAYKLDGNVGKNVEVELLAEDWLETLPQYEVRWNLPKWSIAGWGLKGSVTIKNSGLQALYRQQARLSSTPSGFLENGIDELSLAPGESRRIDLLFKKQDYFENFAGALFLSLGGETFSTSLQAKSVGWIAVGILISFMMVTLSAVVLTKIIYRLKKPPQKNEKAILQPSA